MSGYGSGKRNNQNGFNFRTTSARMQLEHRAGVLQYPSPKRSRHAAEEFQGCTDVIADISRNVKKRDKLNTASSAKEIDQSQSYSYSDESERTDRQYNSDHYYSQKDSRYSDYSQTNYYDYYQNNYSENQYSASVHSYGDENDTYSLHEEEEEEYLSESEKIGKPDEVKLSSYEETGKSNPIDRDLDEAQTSSVQLRSLDNEEEAENEDEDENESITISANNERKQSSSKSNKSKNQNENSEKAPSVKERNISAGQKETDNTNTDSNRSGSRQRKKRTDSLGNSDSIKEDAHALSEVDEDKNDAITNSNSNYNSTQKSEASQHSSSKPTRGKTAKKDLASPKEKTQEEKVGDLSQRFDLLIQANQKLVAAVLENQKAIFNVTHDSYSEEALKHVQAAYDILTNNNH